MSINPRVFQKSSDTQTPHRAVTLATIDPGREPFLNFVICSELSFEEKSRIYCSLVSLVKAGYPFDDALQDKAVPFLKCLEPKKNERDLAEKLVTKLVHSSAGWAAGFVASIVTLLSSPHLTVAASAMSFLFAAFWPSSPIQYQLVKTDLVPNVIAIVQPHTLSISGNEKMLNKLVRIICHCLGHAFPDFLEYIGLADTIDPFNHYEMIFQKVVLPSSQFVTFLMSNRLILNGKLFFSFMSILGTLLQMCQFHRPTLEFVLASPIAMTFTSCHSFIENDGDVWIPLSGINQSLTEWTEEGPEVAQSGKRMMQALISEGFEDTLEQRLMSGEGIILDVVVGSCEQISQKLGLNVIDSDYDDDEETEDDDEENEDDEEETEDDDDSLE
ncbi:hypothetical protein BLNAU_2112 [Blattamonas nauphoetae]|uniref:Uncharacterized protein n=1 Tax=Blattamonas nauphoetae TaxID=2049346 RepID=A0ABQ9YH69_9EUKA|nr:hypothetical protein BLNAU_2112 [Blattamonas nauphoetae]